MPPLKRTRSVKSAAKSPSRKRIKTRSERTRMDVGARPAVFSMPKAGFPDEINTVLTYNYTTGQQSLIAGGSYQNVWRTNSVYDPDYTGIGTQPQGYDQFAAIYGMYYVRKCVVSVRVVNASPTTGASSQVAAIWPDCYTSTAATKLQAIAKTPGQWFTLPSTCVKQFKRFVIYPHQELGLNKRDDVIVSGVATNPAVQTYFHTEVWGDPAESSSYNMDISLEYHVTFFRLINFNDS